MSCVSVYEVIGGGRIFYSGLTWANSFKWSLKSCVFALTFVCVESMNENFPGEICQCLSIVHYFDHSKNHRFSSGWCPKILGRPDLLPLFPIRFRVGLARRSTGRPYPKCGPLPKMCAPTQNAPLLSLYALLPTKLLSLSDGFLTIKTDIRRNRRRL